MITDKKPTIQQMREIMQRMNYAYKTESSYCDWVKRFIKFSQMQSRNELFENAEDKVEVFLTDLVVGQNVAASTQNQAFNALVFLYKEVLKRPLIKRVSMRFPHLTGHHFDKLYPCSF